jgi:hypothetical protein
MGRGVGTEDVVNVEDGVPGREDDTAAAGGGGVGMFVRSKYPSVDAPDWVLAPVPALEMTVVAEEKSTSEAVCCSLVLIGKLSLCGKRGSSSGGISMASSEAGWTKMGCTGGSISGGSSCS